MTTEAGKRLRDHLDSVGDCAHPHPEWVTEHCWACEAIAAIEAEAVERAYGSRTDARLQRDVDMVNAALTAERARIAEAVRGLAEGKVRDHVTGRYYGTAQVSRAAVLAIVDPD